MFKDGAGNGLWCELLYCLTKEEHIVFYNWTVDPEDKGTMIN
jgi:hypothetical protein